MVLNLLLIGLAVALDPLPLSAFVVVLPSKRGVRKGSEAVIRHVHSMAVPANGRCVRTAGAGGQGAPAGLPVVLVAGGVLVGLLAVCPPTRWRFSRLRLIASYRPCPERADATSDHRCTDQDGYRTRPGPARSTISWPAAACTSLQGRWSCTPSAAVRTDQRIPRQLDSKWHNSPTEG
jgi:hypothetical protein